MKYSLKFGAMALAVVVSMAVFTGCSTKEEVKPLTKVKVSEVTHSVFYAPQYAAINLGFFEEEGIEIELSNGQGADKVMAALLSDHIDVGFAGPEAAIYVYNEGKEDYAKIFAQVTKRDGSFLLGREKIENFDWNTLKGSHMLPGRKGGVPYMTLEYTLRSKGLDPKADLLMDDSIQFALMAGAFTGGTADYVTLFEPTASMIEAEGKGYILASIGEESGEIPYTAYFAMDSFLKKNPEVSEGFVRALYKGQKWVESSSPEEIAKAIVPSFPDTDVELLTKVVKRYKDIDAWSTTPVMEKEAFDKLQEVMTQAGELSKTAPFENLVDNTIANKVVDK